MTRTRNPDRVRIGARVSLFAVIAGLCILAVMVTPAYAETDQPIDQPTEHSEQQRLKNANRRRRERHP